MDNFDAVVERQHDAVRAFMLGNTEPFKDIYSQHDDATLANPFGGVAHGWLEIASRLDRAASYYRDGDVVSIETIAAAHGAELGYAIEIERLRARIGSRSDFEDVALRTTTVFRRENTGWKLVHRHADPAVELRLPESTFE